MLSQSLLNLVAARKILPLSRETVGNCIATVLTLTNGELNTNIGELCDVDMKDSIAKFNTEAGDALLNRSNVAKEN